ncbi:class II aldolase/adducin family protein [Candidatus Sumerlaeota bacterium]|nr:class II aldolase/adducin family protein [Candidatus Sumerlaeota bacterium]
MAIMREWEIRELMCDIGRRAWQRGFVAANEGNFSVRISEDEVLTTPTLVSKGFMEPEDICKVDMEGNVLDARRGRKPTSEVIMHIGLYQRRSDIKAVVHLHPPYATAFAVAGEPLPKCILPEVEIFVGEIPIAEYGTPGTPELMESLLPFLENHDTFLLANHGALTAGKDIIDAYYKMEILESYCKILIILQQIGKIRQLNPEHMRRLLAIKERMGLSDRRLQCDIRHVCVPGVSNGIEKDIPKSAELPQNSSDEQGIVEEVVQEVLRRLGEAK